MEFSPNSRQLALGYADGSVAVVALLPAKGGKFCWDLVGQLHPHLGPAPLAGLVFAQAPSGLTRLFSAGTLNHSTVFHYACTCLFFRCLKHYTSRRNVLGHLYGRKARMLTLPVILQPLAPSCIRCPHGLRLS